MARHSAADRSSWDDPQWNDPRWNDPQPDDRSGPAGLGDDLGPDDPGSTVRIHPRAAGRPGPQRTPPRQAETRAPRRPSVPRRILAGLGSLVLLAAVGLAVAVAIVPAAAGGSALTVGSPSMTPTFPVGTLVVIRPRPVDSIRIGDVVSFTDRDPASGATRTVTHRVVGVDPGPRFRTRGDANPAPDPGAVQADEVRGVVWYSIPEVGGWGSRVQSGPGLLLTGGAVLLVIALMLLAPRRRR